MAKKKEQEAWTKVIHLFKDFAYLWDKKHTDYFNRDKRHEAYKMLLLVYQEEADKETTMADFKKKIENMRAAYGRELKKVKSSKTTGSGSNDVYVPALWYYPLLEFLEGTTEPCRPGTDTLDENYWSPADTSTKSEQRTKRDMSDKEVPDIFTEIPKMSKKQKMSIKSRQEKLLDSAQALMTQKEDDWEVIGKSIGIQLKNMSAHQQPIVHKIINDALFYGKRGQLTDESAITLSPQHTASYSSRVPYFYQHFPSSSSMTNSLPQPFPEYSVQPLTQPYHHIIPQHPPVFPNNIIQPPPQYVQQHTFEQSSTQCQNYNIRNLINLASSNDIDVETDH